MFASILLVSQLDTTKSNTTEIELINHIKRFRML